MAGIGSVPFVTLSYKRLNACSGFFRNTFNACNKLGIFIKHHVGQVATIVKDHVKWLAAFAKEKICSMHQSNSSFVISFHAYTEYLLLQ